MNSAYPDPTRKAHQSFCVTEEWLEVRNARGKTGHHVTYELALSDGRVLRTRISHPPNRQTYGNSLWRHILRDQLEVVESEFWACVQDRTKPARSAPTVIRETVPVVIVSQLLANGVAEAEIREMTKEEAIQRMTEIWSQPSA